jgi:flagellin
MAAILSTNMASLYAQKNLSTAQASLSESVQRLSSGTRINSAKDDAAGYGISESVRGTKNIVDQNIRNAKDGISWAQTAEGALDVVGKILQTGLTLSTQFQDPTLNTAQKASIATEMEALEQEIANIAARTKLQAGTGAPAVFGTDGINVDTGAGSSAPNLTVVNPDIVSGAGLYTSSSSIASISTMEGLIADNATNRGKLGAAINSLEYAVDNMQTLSNNLADGISRIVDTDYAAETSNLTRTQILQQAATSMLAQANQMPNVILTLLK